MFEIFEMFSLFSHGKRRKSNIQAKKQEKKKYANRLRNER